MTDTRLAEKIQAVIHPYLNYSSDPFDAFLGDLRITTPEGEIPFHPTDHQMRLFRLMDRPRGICNTSRQNFTTTGLLIKTLYDTLTIPSHITIFIDGKQDQLTDRSNRLIEWHQQASKEFDRPAITSKNRNEIEFENDSRILLRTVKSLSDNIDQGCGLQVDRLLIDHAAYHSHALLQRAWDALLPSLASSGSITLASSPGVPDGLFYRLWEAGGYPWCKMTTSWWEDPSNDARWVELMIAQMGEDAFHKEFCNNFVPLTGSYL